MMCTALKIEDIKDISGELLEPNGKLRIISCKEYEKFDWNSFRFFCHQYARYGLPTIELVEYLKRVIGDRSTIEIGAGAGDLGWRLGIPMTDSKIQDQPEIAETYSKLGQPVIKYGADVEKLECIEAINKYKPKVVIASWVTTFSETQQSYGSCPYGVREKEIMNLVDTYILIGNISSHGDKPIMKANHKLINEPWIISRSANRLGNRIFIWNKKRNEDGFGGI